MPTLPPVFTGALLNVAGDLTLAVPLPLTNDNVTVDGVLRSNLPQTIDGGSLTTDQVVGTDLTLIDGAVITSYASTADQMHKLEMDLSGTLTVDATSSIDVTNKGYMAGHTTGNTTIGAATEGSGASHGGLGGGGTTNALYDDYADPEDWGAGAPLNPGGGLVRVNASTLKLDGKFLADGALGFGPGGAGGGIYVEVQTISGSGLMRAGGGTPNDCGCGGGGGGRIALYAEDYTQFGTFRITAPGGANGGGAGTVYIVQGQCIPTSKLTFPSASSKASWIMETTTSVR